MTDQPQSIQPDADIEFGRPFVLVRDTDVSGVSGVGVVAGGVLFPDGHAVIHWRGAWPTTTPHPGGMESVLAVHGHGGATRVRWQAVGGAPPAKYQNDLRAERDRLADLLDFITTLAFAAPIRPDVRLSRICEALDRATPADTTGENR